MKKVIPFSKTVHFKTMIAEVTDIEVKHTLKATDDQTIEGDILVDGTYKMTEASQIEEEFHYTLPFTIEVDDKYNIQSADIAIHDFYFEIINEEDLKVNVELEINQVEEKEGSISIEEMEENTEEMVEAEVAEKEETRENSEQQDLEVEAVAHEELDTKFLELEQPPKKLELLDDDSINASNNLNANIFEESLKNIEITKEIKQQPTTITLENTAIELSKEGNNLEQQSNKAPTGVSSIFSSISQEETFVTYYVYIVREQDTVESILEKYQSTRDALAAYNDLSQIKPGSKVIIPCSNE